MTNLFGHTLLPLLADLKKGWVTDAETPPNAMLHSDRR